MKKYVLGLQLVLALLLTVIGTNNLELKAAGPGTTIQTASDITEPGTYYLSSFEGYQALIEYYPNANNYEGFTIVLNANIDFPSQYYYESIPQFNGVFDGNGFTIRNVKLMVENTENAGLFNKAVGATFKNLNLDNVSVVTSTSTTVGTLVGTAIDSTFENLSLVGVSAQTATIAGGLVGKAENSTFNAIYYLALSNWVVVSGTEISGGLVGQTDANTVIKNINIDETVLNIQGQTIGGLVGKSDSLVENIHIMNNSTINLTTLDGNTSNAGGIVGIGGELQTSSIDMISISGTITSKDINFGGLSGANTFVHDNYIYNSILYLTATSSGGTVNYGGIIGNNTEEFARNYISKTSVGYNSSGALVDAVGGIAGSTSADMSSFYIAGDGMYTNQVSTTDSRLDQLVGRLDGSVTISNAVSIFRSEPTHLNTYYYEVDKIAGQLSEIALNQNSNNILVTELFQYAGQTASVFITSSTKDAPNIEKVPLESLSAGAMVDILNSGYANPIYKITADNLLPILVNGFEEGVQPSYELFWTSDGSNFNFINTVDQTDTSNTSSSTNDTTENATNTEDSATTADGEKSSVGGIITFILLAGVVGGGSYWWFVIKKKETEEDNVEEA